MGDIAPIIEHLHHVRTKLESAVEAVPAALWRTPPRHGGWSAAEVVAHLTMVERAITDGAARLVRGAALRVPLWKRLHLPVWLAEWRVLRRKTPIPLDPSLLDGKEAMLTRLADVRRDRKSTRLNSSHIQKSRMPSSA